jgi:CRP-like cAMP-binding protein
MIADLRHTPQREGHAPANASLRLLNTRLWTSGLLSPEELYVLENSLLPEKVHRPGSVLIREGEQEDTVSILLDGWACRFQTTRKGGRQLPALLVLGDIVNLDTLMFDRLDYGVQTLTQATTTGLPRSRAQALFAKHSGIARMFTWLAMVENTILSRWALCLGRRVAIERVAHLLCELSVRLAGEERQVSSFALPLTQEQLGDAVGLTSVHVNRMLQALRNDGLIQICNRHVTIPDMARLRRFSGFDPSYLHSAPAVRSISR